MEKVLSQAEIDALFRAAQGEPGGRDGVGRRVLWSKAGTCGIRACLGKEQLHSLNQLYESFARNLTSAVGIHLGDKFEVALVAMEQLTYRDFLARSAEATYDATFRLPPGDGRGILQLDLGLVFPVVDLLLGGPGTRPSAMREVTEIEEALLEGIGQVICQELRAGLLPLSLEVAFEQRQPAAQMPRIMSPQEKTLALTFEVSMNVSKGTLNIIFPSAVSSGLIRSLRTELVYERAHGPAVHQKGIGRQLLESKVRVELATPMIAVRIPQLLALQPGAVVNLRYPIEDVSLLKIKGQACWSARPVDSRNHRAAQLLQPVPQPQEVKTHDTTV